MSAATTTNTVRDPICGMEIDPKTAAAVVEREGEKVYFCSTHCRDKFVSEDKAEAGGHSCCHGGEHSPNETKKAAAERQPAKKYFCPMCEGVESDTPGDCPKCGMSLERNPTFREKAKTIYTCPMHPQIEQDHPGDCPICGMALEPKNVAAGAEEDNTELRDMTRRFWIGAVLSLPVFLLAMWHLIPTAPEWVDGDYSRWAQFILSTPVVLWAGWPFFQRGWRSILNRSLNMFTLIAIGVGAAYFYSAVVMLLPQIFPPSFAAHGKIGVYFEAAAIITVLVLLGQVLEGRARSRTGSAIRALLDLAPTTARVVRDGAEKDVPLDQVRQGDQLRVRPGRKSAGRWPGDRWPNEHRRSHDHRRTDAGGKEKRRPGHRRHGQPNRQHPDRSGTRRERNRPLADRRDGGAGATQSRADPGPGRQGRGLVRARRHRGRSAHFHSLGGVRPRAALRLRNR